MQNILFILTILNLFAFSTNAAELAHMTFSVKGGETYESSALLPVSSTENLYQMTFQSLHSVTLFTELLSDEEKKTPKTKQVTYGLTVESKPVPESNDTYSFSLEYMGIPSVILPDEDSDKIQLINSPEDIRYEVNLTLLPDKPVCSKLSKTSGDDESFGSVFCVTLVKQ